MSIDFSKITGLSDSRGVITQITDASGRVLWSAVANDLPGTFYLIPSAVLSKEGNYTNNPMVSPTLGDASSFINEAVADDDATYIQCSASGQGVSQEATFVFALSGFPKGKVTKVNSLLGGIRFHLSHNGSDNSGDYGNVHIYACVGGVDYNFYTNFGYLPTGVWTTDERSLSNSSELLSYINQYIAANNAPPEITLKVHLSVTASSSKTTVTARLTQAYVVIECE